MNKEFLVHVRHAGGDKRGWTERYQSPDPEGYAKNLIETFNATLRSGEIARELIRVEVLGEVLPVVEHVWSKTNLITKMERSGATYDEMKCDRCGITGRRYGLSPHVVRGTKYADTKFAKCQP